mmetsp:Transcript_21507/g.59048  ORF Transcript_21507/g.59048 Transcript_21507/m.59048 type:complete len:214 (+) Transcript_21507:1-642(+)
MDNAALYDPTNGEVLAIALAIRAFRPSALGGFEVLLQQGDGLAQAVLELLLVRRVHGLLEVLHHVLHLLGDGRQLHEFEATESIEMIRISAAKCGKVVEVFGHNGRTDIIHLNDLEIILQRNFVIPSPLHRTVRSVNLLQVLLGKIRPAYNLIEIGILLVFHFNSIPLARFETLDLTTTNNTLDASNRDLSAQSPPILWHATHFSRRSFSLAW